MIRRRDFITLLGGAGATWPMMSAVSFLSVLVARAPARGQADIWQIYRLEDLGFEIEMPGAPEVEEEENQDKDDPVAKQVDADVSFHNMGFSISYREWRGPLSVDEEIEGQRRAARLLGAKVISETRITMSGVPGAEIVTDSLGGTMLRVFVVQNRRFLLIASGISSSPDDYASVRRFFDSFRLLSARR